MNALPRRFRTLDHKEFRQVPKSDVLVKDLAESGFDKLIVEHRDVVAELLGEAGLIDADSKLKVLAVQHQQGQLLSIDVLFAEIDGKGDGENGLFRRLVVVEDKLEKNAEQRRRVLAQVMDYARELQDRSKRSEILEHLHKHHPEWAKENDEEVQRSLDEGNFLLVLAGDRFDPRLVDLVKHHENRIDPTDLAEICMVGLALFRGPDGMIGVVPNLVGAVTKGNRDITISLQVSTPDGQPLRSEVTEISETREGRTRIRGSRAWEAQSFYAELLSYSKGPKPGEVLTAIEAWAAASGVHVVWGGGLKEGWIYFAFSPPKPTAFLSANTKGRLYVSLANLQHLSKYREEPSRRDLVRRLNQAGGVSFGEDKSNSWTSVPLSTLADEKKRAALLQIVSGVYDDVKQGMGL